MSIDYDETPEAAAARLQHVLDEESRAQREAHEKALRAQREAQARERANEAKRASRAKAKEARETLLASMSDDERRQYLQRESLASVHALRQGARKVHTVQRRAAPARVVAPVQALHPAPEEPPMPDKAPRYWVRWVNPGSGVFKYFGVDYDHGQLVPLRPGPTYDKLLNIMYVAEVDQPRLIVRCGVCGAEFLNERFLNAHGAKRHSARFATAEDLEVRAAMQTEHGDAAVVDVTGDAEERRLMTEFPLALENTTASRQG